VQALSPINRFHDLLETLDTGFKVFNNIFCQHIRIWQVFQISEAFVPDPEDI